MPAVIGAGVSLKNIPVEEFHFTFLLASGITKSDEGKAVTIDGSAANTVKLAADGDEILGRLEVVEDRTQEGILVGTVAIFGSLKFLINPDPTLSPVEIPVVGDYIEGAEDDSSPVKKGYCRVSSTYSKWLVVEVADDDSYCVALAT